jgi:hypothetical protein
MRALCGLPDDEPDQADQINRGANIQLQYPGLCGQLGRAQQTVGRALRDDLSGIHDHHLARDVALKGELVHHDEWPAPRSP